MNEENTDESRLATELLDTLWPLLRMIHASRSLSPGKVGILRMLRDHPRATTSGLSKSIGVSQQAISLAAKELETAGYIERQKDDSDMRKVWFRLTSAGSEKLVSESRVGRAGLMQAIRANLTEEDLIVVQTVIPMLRKISQGNDHVQ